MVVFKCSNKVEKVICYTTTTISIQKEVELHSLYHLEPSLGHHFYPHTLSITHYWLYITGWS